MNCNVVLRHDLHSLISEAKSDQLFTALFSPESPIRDGFVKFLALSHADWLSAQNDIDEHNVKKEWQYALQMKPDGFPFNTIS